MNTTVGSLAGGVLNMTPLRFGRYERRAGASDDTSLNDTSTLSSVAAGAPSRAATTGSRAGPAPRPMAQLWRSVLYMLPALKIYWMKMIWWMTWVMTMMIAHATVMALVLFGCYFLIPRQLISS